MLSIVPNSGATETGGVDGRCYIAAVAPQNDGRVIGAIIVAQITMLSTQISCHREGGGGGGGVKKKKRKFIF